MNKPTTFIKLISIVLERIDYKFICEYLRLLYGWFIIDIE